MPAPDATFGIGETIFPVSYRFYLITPYGQATQELTVDLPFHGATVEVAEALGPLLWTASVATATTTHVTLFAFDMMCWKAQIAPAFIPVSNTKGLLWGGPVARTDTPVIVMHTGHQDGMARRRLFLPGAPRGWAEGGLLTVEGAESLQALARGMFIGIAEEAAGSQFTWMLPYPRYYRDGGLPADGVAFRHVRYLRVCQYTERGPDRGSVVWP